MQTDPIDPVTATPLEAFQPVPLRRSRFDGWTAERQRDFISALAETGSISQACHHVGITARSAYRLRADPRGRQFAAAWDQALRAATAKLLTLAYERAINGSYVEHWRDGQLIGESRQPSDKLLICLLNQLAPRNHEKHTRWAELEAMSRQAGVGMVVGLDALTDSEIPADVIAPSHYLPQPRERGHEPDQYLSPEGEAWND